MPTKIINQIISVDTKTTKLTLDSTIRSYDNQDTIIQLTLTSELDLDFNNATAKAAIEYYADKKYVVETSVNVSDNTLSFALPNNLKGYDGYAIIGVYVDLADGSKIDIKDLVVKCEPSIIDKAAVDAQPYYFSNLDSVLIEFKQYASSKADELDNDVISAKQEIADKVASVDSQSAIDAITSKVADVDSHATTTKSDMDTRLADVNSYATDTLTNVNNVATKAKADIANLVANAQTNVDKASQQVNDYATSTKADMDTAKTSIDDYAAIQKQAMSDVLNDVQSTGDTAKTQINQVLPDVQSEGEKAKTNINAVVSDVNGYADTQKQIISNFVTDVRTTGEKAKTDINAVLPSVKAEISEIKTEIENIPDIPEVYTDLADIKSYIGYTDTDIYGVEIDMVNRRFTRLSGAVGKNGGADFDNINAYKRRRCILTNDGVVLAYYGESNYTESGVTNVEIVKNTVTYPIGTPVQVMVEQPKFYYKVVPLSLEPIANGKGYHMRKGRYYISDYPKAGFKVHPAFIRNGVERDKIYLSAYEGSIYDTSASAYLLDDEQVADFSADMLSSIANAKPCSGLTQNLTRANARLLAHNRGQGFEQQTVQTVSLTQLLFLIEYNTFNMQTAIGMGATQKTDVSGTNMAENTGGTSSLGNASGAVTNTNGIQIVSYRGEENPFGNIWKFVDGINVMANSIHAAYVADHGFDDKQSTGSYVDVGFTLSKTEGYVSAFGYNPTFDWLFLTSETTGNTSVPVGDYFYPNYTATDDGGWRITTLGGGAHLDLYSGYFYWNVYIPSIYRSRFLSGRLVYLGG